MGTNDDDDIDYDDDDDDAEDDDDDDDDDDNNALADDDDDHLRVACYPRAPVSHVTLGRPCHMLSQGGRVTCYPGGLCFALPWVPCETRAQG